MAIQWDNGGNAFAALDDFDGSREITKQWVKTSVEGQQFLSKFYTQGSIDKLTEQLEFHGLPVSFNNLSFVFTILRDSGQLATPQVEVEPDVPKDKNGKPLSPSQLEWRAFAEWANNPKTSSRDIAEKRKSNPSFAKFCRESLKLEMAVAIDGAVEPGTGQYCPNSARGRL